MTKGNISERDFDILIKLSGIHSEKAILALKKYYVDGVITHGVADNFARINIFDASEVQPSLLCGNIRQVRHPDLIWYCRSERLVQQIWRNWQIVARVRSRSELAFLLTA